MEQIKVTIKCSQVVYYEQEVKMSKEDFDIIKDVDWEDINKLREKIKYNVIDKYLDPSEMTDADQEFLNVEITKED